MVILDECEAIASNVVQTIVLRFWLLLGGEATKIALELLYPIGDHFLMSEVLGVWE